MISDGVYSPFEKKQRNTKLMSQHLTTITFLDMELVVRVTQILRASTASTNCSVKTD